MKEINKRANPGSIFRSAAKVTVAAPAQGADAANGQQLTARVTVVANNPAPDSSPPRGGTYQVVSVSR